MFFNTDYLVYWTVVLLRVLVPLTIPRYPLPGVIASSLLDAVDQTLFQTFTKLPLTGYQGYDKALDTYYLAIAYISTLRNWTNYWAFRISHFLFYFRLVGIVLFEVTQLRWLLLVFPNTFEYFFFVYEVVRLRWDPRRISTPWLVGIAGAIWIVIKLPQEYWIHIAQLDMTDAIKQNLLGYPATADWGAILVSNPIQLIFIILALFLVGTILWRQLRKRLPPADWPASFTPDANLAPISYKERQRVINQLAGTFFDYELVEKTILISLLVIIFARVLPGIRSSDLELALAMLVVIVVNTLLSERLVKAGVRWVNALQQGLVMFVINLTAMIMVSFLRYGSIPLAALENIVVFILLLSLIVTLYDRYRPIYLIRFIDKYSLATADQATSSGGHGS